ncbi:hypothetical protein ACWEQL_19130 [Kitasatospora sp. NPDC004240]
MEQTVFSVTLVVALVVGTVTFQLNANRRKARVENLDPTAYGMVPRSALDPEAAGPPRPAYRRREIQAMADAAWRGDWRPVAGYVASAGQDWDERWSRIQLLGQIAAEDDAWLEKWQAAEPGSCDAAVTQAHLMVQRAWKVRGYGYAPEVPAAAMAEFRRLLPAAIEEARRAALLDPRDPNPWVVMITAARGARYRNGQFRELWAELVARAPHHYDAHWQALQYWCAKWHGTDRKMMRFARRTVRRAPAGSPLAGLTLRALYERERRRPAGQVPDSLVARRHLVSVASALALVPEDDPHLPQLRHLLAHHLVRARLWRPALEQFRLIGPWCGAAPWTDYRDPAAAFDLARRTAAARSGVQPGEGVRLGEGKKQNHLW